MKQRLPSVITARQKDRINFLNTRWIVVVLCIILIFATPAVGSANQSLSDLSAQTSLYETMVPTWTTTHSVTPTATQTVTITPSPTATQTATITPSPTATQTATITPSPTATETITPSLTPTWTPTITASPTLTPTPYNLKGGPQILVSANNMLYLYTQTGELLESYEIPYPIEPRPDFEIVQDIAPGPNKTIFVYNGTLHPYLSILDRESGTWTHTTYSGWNSYYGGMGRFSKYIYLTDRNMSLEEGVGILRFNIQDESFENFTPYTHWTNVTIGLDNLGYAHSSYSGQLHVFDPISMQTVHGLMFSVPSVIVSIAVNEDGEIFGVAWDDKIYHMDNHGRILNCIESGIDLIDIDISEKGQFVVSGRSGDIMLLDENLVIQNQFEILGSGRRVPVAFFYTR